MTDWVRVSLDQAHVSEALVKLIRPSQTEGCCGYAPTLPTSSAKEFTLPASTTAEHPYNAEASFLAGYLSYVERLAEEYDREPAPITEEDLDSFYRQYFPEPGESQTTA